LEPINLAAGSSVAIKIFP